MYLWFELQIKCAKVGEGLEAVLKDKNMVPFLSLQFCESSMLLKENSDRKKEIKDEKVEVFE